MNCHQVNVEIMDTEVQEDSFMIVIKYYVRFLDMKEPVYEKVIRPTSGKQISKKEAFNLIEELGLEKAFESKDGIIWDTPDMDFREKYRGFKLS